MPLNILGEHPLAKDGNGKLKSRIATIFPFANTIVTLPGIHATQRLAYLDWLRRQRQELGLAPLSREEEAGEWQNSVDLIMEDDAILIRPDPDNMALAFRADELLQQLVPKHQVRFLLVRNEKVRAAIKQRGECWRHQPPAEDAGRNAADDRRLEDRHPRRRVVLLQQGDGHAFPHL